jgi:hypothetical protein
LFIIAAALRIANRFPKWPRRYPGTPINLAPVVSTKQNGEQAIYANVRLVRVHGIIVTYAGSGLCDKF